jgi:hypothetical protein
MTRIPEEAVEAAKATTLWAIRKWRDKLTPEELVEAIFDAPPMQEALAAALPMLHREGVVEATHRHNKRGSEYVLLGIGRMQSAYWLDGLDEEGRLVDMREVVIYRSLDGGSFWVRPREEFEDGRFSALRTGGNANG